MLDCQTKLTSVGFIKIKCNRNSATLDICLHGWMDGWIHARMDGRVYVMVVIAISRVMDSKDA